MSRYPSSGVERFDRQFAETESERNERLRRKRLKSAPEMPDLDLLHEKENEIARLMGALMRIANIKNELDGDDWSEIEQARTIARLAISPRTSR